MLEDTAVNRTTALIIDSAMRVHRELGPGLLESVYEAILARLLERQGLRVERQKPITFVYEDITSEEGFRADLIVDGLVLVELKSVERLAPVHPKQVLTYLKLLDLHAGLLINFGAPYLKDGIRRIVNGRPPAFLRVSVSPCEA
jgi:GxxExxY protein